MAKIGAYSSSGGDQPRDPFLGLEHSLLGEDGVPTGVSWGKTGLKICPLSPSPSGCDEKHRASSCQAEKLTQVDILLNM